MAFEINEDTLRSAYLLLIQERMASLPESAYAAHSFSARFLRKMRRLEKKAAQARTTATHFSKRMVYVLIAALLAAGLAIGVGAWREKLSQMIEKITYSFSNVAFVDSETENSPAIEQQRFLHYAPSYIPEGFELANSKLDDTVYLLYQNGEGNFIEYTQDYVDIFIYDLDTENGLSEKIQINDCEGKLYTKKDFLTMIWNDGTYAYMLGSKLDETELIKIAESIQLLDTEK